MARRRQQATSGSDQRANFAEGYDQVAETKRIATVGINLDKVAHQLCCLKREQLVALAEVCNAKCESLGCTPSTPLLLTDENEHATVNVRSILAWIEGVGTNPNADADAAEKAALAQLAATLNQHVGRFARVAPAAE